MVSRSILSHWLLLRRTVTAANVIAVGALWIASASPGAAAAATVSVEPPRSLGVSLHPLRYVAGSSERNDVLLVYHTNRDVTITDMSAPLRAGKHCSALDVHSVRCSYDLGPTHPGFDLSAEVKLGDMADRLRVREPSAAGGEESPWGIIAEGGSGPDVLRGLGFDYLYGGSGADRLYGGGVYDYLMGGPGDDRLVSHRVGARDPKGSYILGGPGADTLIGSDGPDELFGSAGDDQLLAGNGDDTLRGGPGWDRWTCGAGVDRVTDPQLGQALAPACEIIRIEDLNTVDTVAFEFSPRPEIATARSLTYRFGCETHDQEPLPYRCSGRLELREAFGAQRLLAHGRFRHAGRDRETWNVRARLTTLGRRIATQRRSILATGSLTGQGLIKSRIGWTFRLSFVSA